MTWRELLLVERNVEILGSRDRSDAAQALNKFSIGKSSMFRGRVDGSKGTLRLRGLMNGSARALHFELIDGASGCLLKGRLEPSFWMKLYRALFLVMFIGYSILVLMDVLRNHQDKVASSLGWLASGFAGFFLFINLYSWLAVLFTRRIERTLIRSVEYVLRDDASAAIAADLLSSSR